MKKTLNQQCLIFHFACQNLKVKCFKVIENPLHKVCDFLEEAMRILKGVKK